MPAGLRVFNDANTIVIDQDLINFVFHSKGSVTTAAPPADLMVTPTTYIAYYATSIATISLSGAPAGGVFAIRCAYNAAPRTFSSPLINGSGAFLELGCDGAAGTTIEWWYFCPVSELSPSTAGAGLRVFTEAGDLAFDSGYRSIKYCGFHSGSASANGGPYSYPSGRDYALIVSAGGHSYVGTARASGRSDFVHVGVGGRVSSNQIYTANVLGATDGGTTFAGGTAGTYYYRTWGVIVVDVTGL